MEVNELRIGNWIVEQCDENYSRINKVWEIESKRESEGFRVNATEPSNILGIELNPDILEVIGFVNKNKNNPKVFQGWVLDKKDWSFSIEWWDGKPVDGRYIAYKGLYLFASDGYHSIDVSHIKYVHQLQNLHYFLTGKELNIEL